VTGAVWFDRTVRGYQARFRILVKNKRKAARWPTVLSASLRIRNRCSENSWISSGRAEVIRRTIEMACEILNGMKVGTRGSFCGSRGAGFGRNNRRTRTHTAAGLEDGELLPFFK
jgi:hypothetical protein